MIKIFFHMRKLSFLTVLLCVIVLWFRTPASFARNNPEEIVAGVPSDFPPQYSIDPKTGQPEGFAVDAMNVLARKTGLKVRYVVFNRWHEIIQAMKEGRIDVVPNEGVIEERKDSTNFTTPLETSYISIFVRSGTTDIKGIDDLHGRKVAVVSDNKGLFIMQEYGKAELIICSSLEKGLLSLISGNTDAFVYPEAPLLSIARRSGLEDRVKKVGKPLFEVKRAVAVGKGKPELFNELDKAVKAFVTSPEYEKIYAKWYGSPQPYWSVRRVLVVAGLAFALILIIFVAWHYFSLIHLNRDLKDSIEKHEKAKELIQASEHRLTAMFHTVNDAIMVLDPAEGRILDVNDIACERLGYRRDELLKMSPRDLDAPEYAAKVSERIADIERRGSAIFETVWVAHDGRTIPTEISARTMTHQGIPAILSIARDITERKLAEEALKKSEEFNRNILETVDEGFIVIDLEYRIISANKAYLNMVNKSEEDVIGEYCYELNHGLCKPCCEAGEDCAVSRTLKTGDPQTAAHTHHDKAGHPVFVETKSFPVKDDSGKIVAAIEVINNITERKKLEGQLRHAQKMEAVGALAGGIAHDFNNILNVIIGYGTMALDRLGDDNLAREQINEVLAAADRATNLTKRLLAFSRKQIVDIGPVNVNQIIFDMEKMLSRIIGEDIVLAIELTGRKTVVMADSGQIEQVLMNLVSNARDAMPKGGTLTISTGTTEIDDGYIAAHGYGEKGTYVLISVTDTGIGMDAETQKKIFEPFFTTKGIGEGTGLGLAITYGIIKQHDGYIHVYSEVGEGTTFKILLPVIEEGALKDQEFEKAAPLRGGTETILVAEDDASLRKLSSIVLESFGYTVITAMDGEDAITKFMENRDKIQLVVLDMIMPMKSGKEVYEEIRRICPDVKALFASGYTMDIITKKELQDKGMDFIPKPVAPKDLLKKVREALDR
jgi:PAS domain S-box-containing protein